MNGEVQEAGVNSGSLVQGQGEGTRHGNATRQLCEYPQGDPQRARASLLSRIPPDEVGKERVIAAIRNLDIARVVLECNQSLSATDYNVEPWRHIGSMNALLTATKKRARK